MTVIVTVQHLREAKFCSRGAAQWFKQHGMDFKEFLRTGIPAERFEATNDALGIHLAKIARDEADEEQA